MPEGDSIFKLADRLRPVLLGRKVTAFESHVIDDAVAETVLGHAVVAVEARGKNLLVRFDDGRALHVHLRMEGRLRVERRRSAFYEPLRSTPQLRLAVEGAAIVGHRIPVLRLLRAGTEDRTPEIASLGPDLAREGFDEDEALRRMRLESRREIGDALLVQRISAGIGNVFKSEVLFLEHIHPRKRVSALDDATVRALLRRGSLLLRRNLRGGRRTTRESIAGSRVWVYHRGGEPCFLCGTKIVRIMQGAAPGRSTYHCPTCQPA